MLRDQRLPEMLQQWSINLSLLAVDLLERILRCQPADRPSVAEIAQHPWLHSDMRRAGGSGRIGQQPGRAGDVDCVYSVVRWRCSDCRAGAERRFRYRL